MAYFTTKSTWLCLAAELGGDEVTTLPSLSANSENSFKTAQQPSSPRPRRSSGRDSRPRNRTRRKSLESLESLNELANLHIQQGCSMMELGEKAQGMEEFQQALKIRHGLVLYRGAWQFGEALLKDNLRLARLQVTPENALFYYCQGRFIGQCLIQEQGRKDLVVQLLEFDQVIAEIHNLVGNLDACRFQAREALQLIRASRFPGHLDARITQLVMRFLNLAGAT